ncbi:Hpt domain-containing protein [Roseospira goensis]|uniref:HPt domain-containing protein n=1 Tax=Roseospira goensis TaxID=391922 RepID=A0A7W6WLJ5_9PROT|nr:Hpt domain-containing protein [Roseospira goensis]MBB4286798.1 hypothetical protein [Roseospira goensis]
MAGQADGQGTRDRPEGGDGSAAAGGPAARGAAVDGLSSDAPAFDDGVAFIDPPATLREKVQGGTAAVDGAALARAEAVITALRADYLAWAADDVERLARALVVVESAPPDIETAKGDLFRIAHDMKGQGGSFGYDLVTVVGDRLCRLVERIEGPPSAPQVQAVRLHVEALRLIIGRRMEGNGGPAGTDLVAGLDRLARKVTA